MLTVKDFAEFSRTTRDALLFYEKKGLISPAGRHENGYRYYTHGQIALVNVIRVFQDLGMTLGEITDIVRNRAPEKVEKLLRQQIMTLDEQILKWGQGRSLLTAIKNLIASVSEVDEKKIVVQYFPSERIILGECNDYSDGKDDYDVLPDFYRAIKLKYPELNLNYPVWGFFSAERIKQRDWEWPERYYFANPEGSDERPAGLYAMGYARGGYGQGGALYERLLSYIDENNFEICGDAYEEYPLNEICIPDSNNYLIRIMIGVRERK